MSAHPDKFTAELLTANNNADLLIEQMIEHIVCKNPVPIPQHGEPVLFSRRTPAQSNLTQCPHGELASWYDQIRMLDADGYPHAFLEVNGVRLEFRRVTHRSDGLHADVKITSVSPSQANS